MKFTLRKQKSSQQIETCKPNLVSLWIHGGIFVVLIAAGVIPLGSHFMNLKQQFIESEQQSLQETQEQVAMLMAQEQFAEFDNDNFFQAALPSESDIIQFVEFFETTASANGVTHTLDLQNQGRSETGAVIMIPVQLQITGSLGYIVQFLADIENQDFYLNPLSITVSNSAGINEEIVTISGETYWSNSQQQ